VSHRHAAGEPAAVDLFSHLNDEHGIYMSGRGFEDMQKTHDALHAHQQIPERAVASGAAGHE
jgi:hypothetical protein